MAEFIELKNGRGLNLDAVEYFTPFGDGGGAFLHLISGEMVEVDNEELGWITEATIEQAEQPDPYTPYYFAAPGWSRGDDGGGEGR